MTKINSKCTGFSLIELLFAMLFLSVIVFGVIKLQTSNLTLSNTKQLELDAYNHATQGLEIVSALGHTVLLDKFDDVCSLPSSCACKIVPNGDYEFACADPPQSLVPESLEGGDFQRSFTLEPEPDGETLIDAFLVTSVVSWTDSSGDHQASAKRIISD